MQKEVIIAIAFGSLLGLAVAFGVWQANKNLSSDKPHAEEKEEEVKKMETIDNTSHELSIVSPRPHTVFTSPKATVSGLSTNSKYAIVITKNSENIALIENGEFSFEVELEGGLNTIDIFGINDAGDVVYQILPLVHSTELSTSNKNTTDIHTRVQERLNQQINPTIALIGTVTDITEDYFQIRSQSGEINQLGISGQTTYGSDIQDSKDIEFGDVAIGDFIVAMGKFNDNKILNTERVLVTTAPAENNYLVIKGTLSDINRSELTLSDGSVFRLGTHTDYWDTSEASEITRADFAIGSEVIIAGEQNGDSLWARSVFMLSF